MLQSKILTVCLLSALIISCRKTVDNPILLGREIFKDVSTTLMQTVAKKVNDEGAPNALLFCSTSANKLMSEKIDLWRKQVVEQHGFKDLKVSRKTLKPRNAANLATGEAEEILLSWENAKEATPTFREDNNLARVYMPIKIASPLCLACHGTSAEIQAETKAALAKAYPNDRATGYALGDLRGTMLLEFIRE